MLTKRQATANGGNCLATPFHHIAVLHACHRPFHHLGMRGRRSSHHANSDMDDAGNPTGRRSIRSGWTGRWSSSLPADSMCGRRSRPTDDVAHNRALYRRKLDSDHDQVPASLS